MKTCTKCRQTLNVVSFQKNRRNRDGLQTYCRDCMNEVNRRSAAKHRDAKRARTAAWYQANKERKAAQVKAWRLANAEHLKAQRAAYREANRESIREKNREYTERTRDRRKAEYAANPEPAKARARRWGRANSARAIAKAREWRLANPERYRAMMRLAQQRRRARKANLPTFEVLDKDIRRILASPCAVAGCTSTDIQIDHVIPVARGGSHGVGNFQPLCSSHNASKCDRTWMEFRVYLSLKAAALAA